MTRTRFAPSPTGALHAGTVRTALFAWLAARHAGGKFLLRIEDTDQAREVSGAVDNIIESLTYLGIDWDEGPDKGGPHGPYIQTDRLAIYKNWAQKLIDAGCAYADPYSKEEVEAFRQSAQSAKRPFLYRNHRPTELKPWNGSVPLRFKSTPKPYKWHDEVLGDLSTGAEVVDDFILIKSDGFPTYNFAHIIDDHLMDITLVVRSQEFISSMPNFLNLYDALELKRPIFATVPIVLGIEGTRKLSKREGAKQLLDYRQMGILPEALMNCLATTGWNDGTDKEIFSEQELIQKFELSRVQKSGARFDEKHLEWMNGHYIRAQSLNELAEKCVEFWPKSAAGSADEYKNRVLAAVQDRLKYLAELPALTNFFFVEPTPQDVMKLYEKPVDKGLKNLGKPAIKKFLTASEQKFKQVQFETAHLSKALNQLLDELDSTPGVLFATIRVAITGSASSPGLADTLAIIGQDEILRRINKAIDLLS